MTDYNKAAEALRLALPLMAEKKVAATPVNYAVFFEYVSKTNEQLNAELETVMAANATLPNDIIEELYDKRLLEFELAKLRKMQQGLRTIVDAILCTLKETDNESARYLGSLDDITQELTHEVDAEKLLNIVHQLSRETRQVQDKQSRMKQDMAANQQEVLALRRELEKVRQEATVDPLTGLLNRKALDNAVKEQIGADQELCALIIDIDKFKRINDTYGHLVGDKVIRYVASTIKNNVPADAIVSRFGGEEFVVLLPARSLAVALDVAEKVRKAQEKGSLITSTSNETIGKVTVSIGVASHVRNESIESFFDRADKALYQAKTNGRNCVVKAQNAVTQANVATAC